MASEKVFPKGLRSFKKNEKAPDFVLGTLLVTPNELVKWLKENPTYLTEYKGEKQLKLQILKGKEEGMLTFVVDTYKAAPKQSEPQHTPDNEPDTLPF